ncbi:carbonic anhydrase 4-like [Channa argus]|uniref:carbonic anhydrase 4-like n=1 Tax=Channa argus TaxID=215402 RepID=UPI0035230A07
MKCLVLAALVCALIPGVHCVAETVEWCYDAPACNDTTWAVTFPAFCNGTRQSPINIVSASAKPNSNLTAFTFQNYNNKSALQLIQNTHHTVRVSLGSGVNISGGDLSESYDSLQFHLHWGNGSSVPGSEHTVDGKRFPMELHIVNTKSRYNGNTTLASEDPNGIAAFGFLIEVMPGNATGQPEAWRNLTSYLTNITNSGDSVSMAPGISLDDLLVGVNRTKYYRYLGSLTTPDCNEAVVWTVFKDSIKVSKDLIDLFSTTVHVSNSSSPFMINTYRSIQPAQQVTTQPSSSSSAFTTCYSLVLMSLGLALALGWN